MSSALKAIELIRENLEMEAHPEGGFFKEVYRSEGVIDANALPPKFQGNRHYLTSIYFLLIEESFSAFHRILSDELWYFHKGDPIAIHVISPDGHYEKIELGKKQYQFSIPAESWFASETTGAYSLVSCAVAPGFDFKDFELAKAKELVKTFPQHQRIITQFCRE